MAPRMIRLTRNGGLRFWMRCFGLRRPLWIGKRKKKHALEAGEELMAIRVVRLGTPRAKGEGLRIGTVRRPPRGVPKSEFASKNWYDVWFPNLAASLQTMKLGLASKTAG